MKRIIVSLDGTWQTRDQDNPTNIKLIHDSIAPVSADGVEQIKQHFDGVGTKGGKLKRMFSGLTGADLEDRIKEAYKYIVENYEDGDEVVLSGFSRGAFTARTLNGMIYKSGIIDPNKVEDLDKAIDEAYDFYKTNHKPNSKHGIKFREENSKDNRPQTVLACFDTVGSLGVPVQLKTLACIFNGAHEFHDTRVNRNTKHAFHIAAIDEQRKNFPLTPMQSCKGADTVVKQLWCVGNHGAIGGGSEDNEHKPLSDIAGLSMIELLTKEYGLGFDAEKVKENFNPDVQIKPESDFKHEGLLWKITGLNEYRVIDMKQQFDYSVHERWKSNDQYRPAQLKKFSDDQGNFPICKVS